ncbi:MAG: hypothetical protein AUK53_04890 [Betaproteobacteria bacterium CG2_30_59_46]|nr:MAG: hypothetical protein AUK53_04890 [Betaproteobacteria bacterium CG2_30_59_46]
MGIQDRDYYHEKRDGGNRKDTFYDPKRFREGRAPATIQPAKWSWQTMVKHTLIWIAIFLILMIIFNRYGPVRQQARSQPPAQSIGSGSLDLQQTRGGHYFSSGAVNGFPWSILEQRPYQYHRLLRHEPAYIIAFLALS